MLSYKRLTLLLEEHLIRRSFNGIKVDMPEAFALVKEILILLEWYEMVAFAETNESVIHEVIDLYQTPDRRVIIIPKKKDVRYTREECLEISKNTGIHFDLFEERAKLEQ